MNRPGHDGLELAAAGECRGFFERSCGGARGFRCRFAGLAIWLPARATYSVESGTRPDFRGSSTISGPIPAQSPSVMPMRGFVVLVLMLVIVIEFVHSGTNRIGPTKKMKTKEEEEERDGLGPS